MKQLDKIDINELKSFEIKEYVIKIISNWKLFLVVFAIGLLLTSFINNYKQKIYSLKSIIAVKEEQNPLFTSTTNIAFNWGGPSDKVENIMTILKSRTHNEKVVDSLKSYINYMQKGRYRLNDISGYEPFEVVLDSFGYQLLNHPIKLQFLENEEVLVAVEFEDEMGTLINYDSKKTKKYIVKNESFSKNFNINNKINTPFCKFKIDSIKDDSHLTNKIYYVVFKSYNGTVSSFQNINASTLTKGTSLIQLELKGTNKKKIEDYLNATVEVLDKDQRKQKIEYAEKTKDFITEVFDEAKINLGEFEKELGEYRQKNKVFNLSIEGQVLFNEVSELDKQATADN